MKLREWQTLTAEQLRPLVKGGSGFLVTGAPRKGNLERMPKAPVDMRYPGRKAPVSRAYVVAVTKDGVRCLLESGAGGSWWVDVNLLTFNVDEV